jgi:hypothetical protein
MKMECYESEMDAASQIQYPMVWFAPVACREASLVLLCGCMRGYESVEEYDVCNTRVLIRFPAAKPPCRHLAHRQRALHQRQNSAPFTRVEREEDYRQAREYFSLAITQIL